MFSIILQLIIAVQKTSELTNNVADNKPYSCGVNIF